MSKREYASFQQDQQSAGSESSTVRVPAGSYQLTEDDRRRLKALAERPDDEIDFSDIPRLTREEYEEALRMIQQRKKLRKAS